MKKTALLKSKAKTAYGLLSEIRRLILEEPLRYNQQWWLSRRRTGDVTPPKPFPSCGTVGCVAGWVVTLKGKSATDWKVEKAAAKVLGLKDGECCELFSPDLACGHPQTVQHAKSGARHIAAFQKKYAAQLKAKKV